MAEPTLVAVFGANATQNATDLVIKKSDLAAMGLTATASNTAESLLASIVLLASGNLTEANRFTDTVNRQIAIEFSANDIIDDGVGNEYLRRAWSFMIYTAYTVPEFDPDSI